MLGGNENAARARVVRAVEKLRRFFHRRGVAVSAVALSGVLLSNAAQAAPPGFLSSLAGCAAAARERTSVGLVQALLRRLRWRRLVRVAAGAAIFLALAGATSLEFRQRRARQAARLAEAARGVREAIIALDRSFTLDDPRQFVASINFRNAEEERFSLVLADYVRAESVFRREMPRTMDVQQRAFDITFSELIVGQPPVLASYIGTDRAATNVMQARYPCHLVKVGSAWKWDFFAGLSREARVQRMAVIGRQTELLETLARQVHDGVATNLTEVLRTVQKTAP